MTSLVPGISGALLPERYVAAQLLADVASAGGPRPEADAPARLRAWWQRVGSACGPASPIRVLFDDIAMPLFSLLGFRAQDVSFDARECRAHLRTGRGAAVALVLVPWASRPSSRWANLAGHAYRIGAEWGFVLAPPFLSLVPTRGFATRRSIDLNLPLIVSSTSMAQMFAVAHATNFEAWPPGSQVSRLNTILERTAAFQDAVRIDLQDGVETSLRTLTPVFTQSGRAIPPAPGRPARASEFDQALTLVYRILFLLFAESRGVVPVASGVYRNSYAVGQLCRDAAAGSGTGLWDTLAATTRLSRLGCQAHDLQVEGFNGALFARASAPLLETRRRRGGRGVAAARDEAVRRTLVALGSRPARGRVESINYRDLGVEQLGAVYERVLDLDGTPEAGPPRAAQGSRHSRLRRQTGTFYTPQPLAEFVVRRTLAPLVECASADDILELRVVDPAMGSGAFLVAACRYLASAYEDALVAEGRVSAEDVDDHERARMRRRIAERCLAGVDRNTTAVHLARLSLWLTTLAHGRPLGFLDHRLRVGDSLAGAWPVDLQRTVMRPAHAPMALPLFDGDGLDHAVHAALGPLQTLLDRQDKTVADVRTKHAVWSRFLSCDSPLHRWRLACHIWCSRWFVDAGLTPANSRETRALVAALTKGDGVLPAAGLGRRLREAAELASRHGFFHWPLEFPDVFYERDGAARTRPGFDAVIGNPPWEMLRREHGDSEARPRALLRYVRQSGQYPSCTDGHLNLYQAFVDRALALVRPGGRLGLVLPWSLATDDGARRLRRRLLGTTRVDTWLGLDNARALFPIHRALRFAVVTATAGGPTDRLRIRCGLRSGDELDRLPARPDASTTPISLTPDDIEAASGPAFRIPDLRRPADLELLLSLARRFPRLASPDGWGVTFCRELNATAATPRLLARGSAGIPVVEGKHLQPFTVDTAMAARMSPASLASLIDPRRIGHPRPGYRDVSGVGNRRTLIAAVVPAGVVTTHTVLCVRQRLVRQHQHFLCALLNSAVTNMLVRWLMGSHVTTSLAAALPLPIWHGDDTDRQIAALSRLLATGRADASAGIRLQALVGHRFGLTRDELQHVLDGSPMMPPAERQAVFAEFTLNPGRRPGRVPPLRTRRRVQR